MELSTQGFIKGVAVNSPVGSAFELLANPAGDWLFMAGMLGAGDTLGLGTWWFRLVGDSWLR